jgi:hypothetical protein
MTWKNVKPFVKPFKILSLLLLTWGVSQAKVVPFDTTALCSGVKMCLGETLPQCSPAHLKANSEIKYNQNFCDEYKVLRQRGISLQDPHAQKMWMRLGQRYRIEYEASGVLPIRFAAMNYLMGNLPFAAELVNAYQGTKYMAVYTDGKVGFEGNNGRNLEGKFRFLSRDSVSQNVFWGRGIASVLAWKLVGDAVTFLDYQPMDERNLVWQVRLVAFPANSSVNSIMGTSYFRGKVVDYFKEIVGHVQSSADAFAKGDRGPIAKSAELQDAQSQIWLKEFEAVLLAAQAESAALETKPAP